MSTNVMWFIAGAVTLLVPALIVFGITGRRVDARRRRQQRVPPELGGRRAGDHDERIAA